VGVLRSASEPLRQVRRLTYSRARRCLPLPYGEVVAEHVARLPAAARPAAEGRRDGRHHRRDRLADDLTIWTQDGDVDVLKELQPALQVHSG
jgi:hypothetical protein